MTRDYTGYTIAHLFGLGCVLGLLIVAVLLLRDIRDSVARTESVATRAADSLDTIEKAVDRLP